MAAALLQPDPTVEARYAELRAWAAADAARARGEPARWWRPAGLTDPYDFRGLGGPFATADLAARAQPATTDPGRGTPADLILAQHAVSALVALERAARARYLGDPPRLAALGAFGSATWADPAGPLAAVVESGRRLAAASAGGAG
jgi:hypothetical protein